MKKVFFSFGILLLLSLNISTYSCNVQRNTITSITEAKDLTELINEKGTTFILVRHAEKMSNGSDPNLTTAGQLRAAELSRILKNVDLTAIYSTDFSRTLETAQPTVEAQSIAVDLYNAKDLSGFVDDVLSLNKPQKVLVVGHSNSTPSLINVLTGTNEYKSIPETDYNNIYLVTVFKKGRAKVAHMNYGE